MKITVFRTLTDRSEIREIAEHEPLYRTCSGIDFNNAVVIVNGREQNASYVPLPSDVIMIRQLPSENAKQEWDSFWNNIDWNSVGKNWWGLLVLPGLFTGLYINDQTAKLNKEVEKLKKLTGTDIDNRPFIAGSSNGVATGQSQPYICGRNLFTPYLLQDRFYALSGTDGKDQYLYEILECGFNSQILQAVKADDLKLKDFTDTAPQEGAFSFNTDSVFYDGGRLELAQDGKELSELSVLNIRTVSKTYNNAVPYYDEITNGDKEYLTYTLDRYAKNVDIAISFPNGFYRYDDSNNKVTASAGVIPEYSVDGGKTYTAFAFDINGTPGTYFETESEKEIRYTAHCDFTLSDYISLKANGQTCITVRIRCTSEKDSKTCNASAVLFVQSQCYDPNRSSAPAGIIDDAGNSGLVFCRTVEDRERAYCTMLGIRIKASELNQDKLTKINIITQSIARTWTGKDWTAGKTATRNNAALALEVLTSSSHPASRCSDSEIDLDSFGDWYEYCEKNSYKFDYTVTTGATKESLLQKLTSAGDASIYRNIYGKLAVAVDTYKENAIAVFNSQNITSIENRKSFSRRIDGIRVKYISSADDLYKEDSVLVMRDGCTLDEDSILKSVTVDGITTYGQIVKYCRRYMANLILHPKTTTIKIGNEGIYYTPLSKILLQDDSLKTGLSSGVIRSVLNDGKNITGLLLRGAVTFESGKKYGLIINHVTDDGNTVLPVKITGTGRTDTVTFAAALDCSAANIPAAGDTFSFGELDGSGEFTKITSPYLVSDISRSGNGWTLTLSDYNTACYETGTIPAYQSNITEKPVVKQEALPADYVTNSRLHDALSELAGGTTAVPSPDVPAGITAAAGQDSIEISCSPFGNGLSNTLKAVVWQIRKTAAGAWQNIGSTAGTSSLYTFSRTSDGYPEAAALAVWSVRAQAVNIYGKSSAWSAAVPVSVSSYGTWLLQKPDITARVSGRAVTLFFSQPARSDGRTVYGTVSNRVQVKRLNPSSDTQFYKPSISADPKAAADNYRDGTGYVTAQDMYQQTMPLYGQNNKDSSGNPLPSPADTSYSFQITAQNEAGTSPVNTVSVIALATSAEDIVDAAITHNKLTEGCVYAENIHGHSITADQMAATDLAAANVTIGKVSGNGLNAGLSGADSMWNLDSAAAEFRVGNSRELENSGSDDGEYFHYLSKSETTGLKRAPGIYMKIKNFIVSAVSSVILGVFRVKMKGAADTGSFMTVNPSDTADAATGTPAKTVNISGNVKASSFTGPLHGSADTAETADKIRFITDSEFDDDAAGDPGLKAGFKNSLLGTNSCPLIAVRRTDGYGGALFFDHVNDNLYYYILKPSYSVSNSRYFHRILVDNVMPVGSVYIQMSGQSDPASLFGGTWSNISSAFAGAFFRAEGGSASAFASGQQAMSIQSHSHTIGKDTTNYRLSGLSSNGTRVMQREGDGNGIWNTDAYGSTETRPVNYTVRIWKRIL